MATYAVIDFETTGLSPAHGARPTEIAVVIVEDNAIVDRYQSLMNAGVSVPYDIQQLTGITNAMVKKAPAASEVMKQAATFVGKLPLLAHNASFDRKFWVEELARIKKPARQDFACSVLLSRRLFQFAPNYQLATLVKEFDIPSAGDFHRAMVDAEYTAHLLIHIQSEITRRYKIKEIDHELLLSIQAVTKNQIDQCVERYRSGKSFLLHRPH